MAVLAGCESQDLSGLDDMDGDGVPSSQDCDDERANVYPGATDDWYDGVDADCEGDSDFDADGDGYDSATYMGPDCDDANPDVGPDAEETWYDDIDQDCDGANDYDADQDGYVDRLSGGDDCDDSNPEANPGAAESWYDGNDDDCDGGDDFDADSDGYASDDYGGSDCDDHNRYVHPEAGETWYDGIDQDCDGFSDYDTDRDGYTDARYGGDDCDDTDSSMNPGAPEVYYDGLDGNCTEGDEYDADSDGYDSLDWGGADCGDSDPLVYPGATETWYDGVDQDCDGRGDYDVDFDGSDSAVYGGTDCDDADPSVHGGASERCDSFDNDCDSIVDEDVLYLWYLDADGDGFGDPSASVWDCAPSAEYVDNGADCDDTTTAMRPGAYDVCDALDNDCSGYVDDGGSCPCGQGWYSASAYLFCTTLSTWSAAEATCEGWGYHLVTVNDSGENAWLASMSASYSGSGWWLGYNDRLTESTWVWDDGSTSTWTSWSSGEPNNSGDEDCAQLYSSGLWNDATCDSSYAVLCEAD